MEGGFVDNLGVLFMRYIGGDVVIIENGFKIIEANSLTSLGIFQRDGAFLENKKLRKFFIDS